MSETPPSLRPGPLKALKALFDFYDWLSGLLNRLLGWALTAAVALMFIVIMTQVLLRYVFGVPLFWVPELAGYLLAFLALCGSSICIRERMHVKVTVLYALLPNWLRHLVIIFVYAVVAYYAWAIMYFGLMFAELGRIEYSPSGTFNLYWIRYSLVIGGALILIQSVNVILREWGILMGLYEESHSYARALTADEE
ncbi:TRAP transporter small permease [Halomonas sp. ML-15]|uniref:TRAP transporter small permease n=1 Tax=Halomonas sp. ML-15 TaxID=2773305 RepID=UPI001746E488|nr:TRAP transporter small permease [Halomonas sp. ML-15]MBD3897567.1 TRAP transporter small permease [Halomonas sp. ML-15]